METIIVGGTLGLTILILLAEVISGILRGSKATLYRIGSILLVGVIALIAAPLLTDEVILSIMNYINPKAAYTSVSEIISAAAAELGLRGKNIVPVLELVEGIVKVVGIPFIFVLFFWVCKLVSWPLFEIIRSIIRRCTVQRMEHRSGVETKNASSLNKASQKASEEAAVAQEAETTSSEAEAVAEEAETKHIKPVSRVLGAALGLVLGLLLGAMTFMPFTGLAGYIETAAADGHLNQVSGADVTETLVAWKAAPALYIYRFTGTEALGGLLYKTLAKNTINNIEYRADLQLKELAETVPAVLPAYIIYTENGFDAERLIPAAETAVQKAFSLKCIPADTKLALCNEYAEKALDHVTGLKTLPTVLKSSLKKLTIDELENDAVLCLYLAGVLSRHGYGAFMKGEEAGFDLNKITPEFTGELSDTLYQMTIAEDVVPVLLNTVLEIGLESMKVEVVYPEKIENFTDTKQKFAELLNVIPELYPYFSDEKTLSSLTEVNRFKENIDVIKYSPFITELTYLNLQKAVMKELLQGVGL